MASVNLQRRHFELIAGILLSLRLQISDDEHVKVVEAFVNGLSRTNACFKKDRFRERSRGTVKPIKAARVPVDEWDKWRAEARKGA